MELEKWQDQRKNGTYLNVCIDTPIFDCLVQFGEDAWQTKTIAVERALMAFLDDYEEKQKMLKELDSKKR